MTYIYVKRELRKQNHDVYLRQAGAHTKNQWHNRTVFEKLLGLKGWGNILAGKGNTKAGSGNEKGKDIVRAGYGNKMNFGIKNPSCFLNQLSPHPLTNFDI